MQEVPPVNRHAVAGGCAAILLALPLMLLLWGLLMPEVPASSPVGARISPMLDPEQRMRLMTYRRECNPGVECEPPLGCLFEARYNQSYCTDSQCMTDAQCRENHVCRPLATKENGPLVRICVPLGVRQEGEFCDPSPEDREHACAARLVCGGHNHHWCGRPCRPGTQATECPAGFFCADTDSEPICLPTCAGRECPEGQHCVRFAEGASVCARVYGPSCRESPCPGDQVCRTLTKPPHPGKVWMECIERCGNGYPACGSGKVCDGWQCLPSCSPSPPSVCAPGFQCRQPWPDSPSACRPDW
jgi:hypothetical protein